MKNYSKDNFLPLIARLSGGHISDMVAIFFWVEVEFFTALTGPRREDGVTML